MVIHLNQIKINQLIEKGQYAEAVKLIEQQQKFLTETDSLKLKSDVKNDPFSQEEKSSIQKVYPAQSSKEDLKSDPVRQRIEKKFPVLIKDIFLYLMLLIVYILYQFYKK